MICHHRVVHGLLLRTSLLFQASTRYYALRSIIPLHDDLMDFVSYEELGSIVPVHTAALRSIIPLHGVDESVEIVS